MNASRHLLNQKSRLDSGALARSRHKGWKFAISNLDDAMANVRAGAPDECWPWTKALYKSGYGRARFLGRQTVAHRVVWTLIHGDPQSLQVCHRCDNRKCCNPSHLFLGTAKVNSDDKIAKGRERWLRGSALPAAKLNEVAVLEIRRSQETTTALAKRFGVSFAAVALARKGATWKHV
jgi:hypothetical protein